MAVQLFGLSHDGKQIYTCSLSESNDAKRVASDILDGMENVDRVIAVENVPSVCQIGDSFHISYRTHFLFIDERDA